LNKGDQSILSSLDEQRESCTIPSNFKSTHVLSPHPPFPHFSSLSFPACSTQLDFTTAAARSYARQVAQFKPGNSSKKNSNNSSDSQALIRNEDASGSQNGLNKGYEALNYGDHKPDEKALERVIGHLNSE